MKSLQNRILEARTVTYRVAINPCADKNGLPVDVSIIVDAEDVQAFEKFLKDEQDDLFAHAAGGNVEY